MFGKFPLIFDIFDPIIWIFISKRSSLLQREIQEAHFGPQALRVGGAVGNSRKSWYLKKWDVWKIRPRFQKNYKIKDNDNNDNNDNNDDDDNNDNNDNTNVRNNANNDNINENNNDKNYNHNNEKPYSIHVKKSKSYENHVKSCED